MPFHNLGELNRHFVYKVSAGETIVFTETGEGGEGNTLFEATCDALVIKAPKRPPLVWALKNQAFAEGAFFTFNVEADDTCLHIVEMKSRLTADDFNHVLKQFKAMYLVSLGVTGILRLSAPKRVCMYIAYKRLAIEQSQPIFLKSQVGGLPTPGMQEWRSCEIKLPDGMTARLIKGERIEGDINFGAV